MARTLWGYRLRDTIRFPPADQGPSDYAERGEAQILLSGETVPPDREGGSKGPGHPGRLGAGCGAEARPLTR